MNEYSKFKIYSSALSISFCIFFQVFGNPFEDANRELDLKIQQRTQVSNSIQEFLADKARSGEPITMGEGVGRDEYALQRA